MKSAQFCPQWKLMIAGSLLILLGVGCSDFEQKKLQNQITILKTNLEAQQRVIEQQQRVIDKLTKKLEATGAEVAPGVRRETEPVP